WIDALIKNQPVVIYGDGNTSRDFCFVQNIVQANLLAATCDNSDAWNKVYNIALGGRTTLNELFALLQKLLSNDIPAVQNRRPIYEPFRPGDIRHSQADISLAKKCLGYQPEFGLEDGLRAALKWYCKQQTRG
ncbi:MAG TPA: GDP-mannose 4,6-dehydratase, partial [Verrucomicrobiae bacterium]